MNTKFVLSALMSMVLVSVIVMVPALQTSTNAVTTTTEESSAATFEERLLSLAEWLPESVKSHITKIASMHSDLASEYPDLGPRMVEPLSPEWEANIRVGRYEYVEFIVDKSFAPVKPGWGVDTGTYYVADSYYYVYYSIGIEEGTDPGLVTLTDTWKKGMIWGTGADVAKAYYLLHWDTDIPDAGPWNYDPATGLLSITFNPIKGPKWYHIRFIFLAKTGFVNQFISKPKVEHTLSPKTTPPLTAGTFYDMWLRMKGFKVKGLPLRVLVGMRVPYWQSTENGVYIKNMDPQIETRAWWGADPPDVPGPEWGWGEWYYDNWRSTALLSGPVPLINPPFFDHWIQVAFQKSPVTPVYMTYLYDGWVYMDYANKGFGIVTGDTPQLTLSPADWDISVTTGLKEWDVVSHLYYHFEEPKSTIIT